MRAYLNQTITIPFVLNQASSGGVTISIMKLSDGTLSVTTQAMAAETNNIHTYSWTTPKVVEQYQAFFTEADTGYTYAGPLIDVRGGMVFTVVTDGSNSATTFKTDLAETVNDFYIGPSLVKWLSGALLNQTRRVASTGGYTGATKFLTMAVAFTATPADSTMGLLITE